MLTQISHYIGELIVLAVNWVPAQASTDEKFKIFVERHVEVTWVKFTIKVICLVHIFAISAPVTLPLFLTLRVLKQNEIYLLVHDEICEATLNLIDYTWLYTVRGAALQLALRFASSIYFTLLVNSTIYLLPYLLNCFWVCNYGLVLDSDCVLMVHM